MSNNSKDNKPRIVTLDNIGRPPTSTSSEEDDDDENAFYAGGSERSGQMIVDPRHHNHQQQQGNLSSNRQPDFERMFRRIVGNAERDTSDIDERTRVAIAQGRLHTLHLWSDGFSLDNGPLVSLGGEEAHAQFLSTLVAGRLPRQLEDAGFTGGNHLRIDDQHHQKFPKKTVKPFSGSGRILGSPTPDFTNPQPEQGAAVAVVATAATAADEKHDSSEDQAKRELGTRDDEETGTLAVRMQDGRRLRIRFNPGRHTLVDIRKYIVVIDPKLAYVQFDLMAGVPVPKQIENEEKLISELGLCNAVVVVKQCPTTPSKKQ